MLVTQNKATALDPLTLDAHAADAARHLMREGSSANTEASYRSAIRYWAAWYALRYGLPFGLPVAPAAVIQFIVDHAQRIGDHGLVWEMPDALDAELVRLRVKTRLGAPALNTVLLRLSVLSKAHDVQGHANPCTAPVVKALIAKTRSAYAKRGAVPKKKKALTKNPFEAMLQTCDDSMRGVRDRALLLFAWSSGGRRRSEVTQATVENVVPMDGGYVYSLVYSKTNQTGLDRTDNAKPIVGQAARALKDWLTVSGVTSGPIFRRIRRGDVIGEPLAPAAVRAIVRERCLAAGLDEGFSAHSLRSGFITEAARQDVPLGEIMSLTGQTSVRTVMGYYQAGRMTKSRALDLLGDTDTP